MSIIAEQITLNLVAGMSAQETVLLACFDAFGDHRQSERLAHADDGGRNRPVFRAFGEVPNEGSIDLDGIDRKFLHQGHR